MVIYLAIHSEKLGQLGVYLSFTWICIIKMNLEMLERSYLLEMAKTYNYINDPMKAILY